VSWLQHWTKPHVGYDKIESRLQTSNEALSEVKDQSYEDIMSSAYTIPTPSQLPTSSPLHKSLGVPPTIQESEAPTDNTEPLQDTPTAPSASQDVPSTPAVRHSPKPHLYEADVTHGDTPSEHVQEGHTADVAAEPVLVANGNLNTPSSVPAAADGPPAVSGDIGPSQENDNVKGELGAHVTNESSMVIAEEAGQNGHTECDDKPQLEAIVTEPADDAPDSTAAPVLDKTNAHTNETNIHLQAPSTEILRPNESGDTGTVKEAPEDATVPRGDPFVLEGVQVNGHDSAKGEHGGENSADSSQVPAGTATTPVPNEPVDHSETAASPPSLPVPTERPDETPTAVPIVGRVTDELAGDPPQPPTGEQDAVALSLSAETTEGATSQPVEPVIEAAEPPPSDWGGATVDKGSEPGVLQHDDTDVKEQLETYSIAKGAPPAVVGFEDSSEDSTCAPQCLEPVVKETEQAFSSQQEERTMSAAPVLETPTPSATDAQDQTSTEPAGYIPAQSTELASAAPDMQPNTEGAVEPSLPPAGRPEATNHPQGSQLGVTEAVVSTEGDIATASLPASAEPTLADNATPAPPPEEPIINVQAETDERKPEDTPKEGADELAQPGSNADSDQGEVKEEAAEFTKEGTYRSFFFIPPNRWRNSPL
jgi:hypothetical protein